MPLPDCPLRRNEQTFGELQKRSVHDHRIACRDAILGSRSVSCAKADPQLSGFDRLPRTLPVHDVLNTTADKALDLTLLRCDHHLCVARWSQSRYGVALHVTRFLVGERYRFFPSYHRWSLLKLGQAPNPRRDVGGTGTAAGPGCFTSSESDGRMERAPTVSP